MQEAISLLSKRIEETRHQIKTEEATKNAFVMPFLSALGYDVFNPTEVIPEFTADLGLKQGEKVDYGIKIDGELVLLIECKPCHSDLSVKNESQLKRYFHTQDSKFAVLTNGIVYNFYTDLQKTNVMDEAPFLKIDLTKPQSINYQELEKFTRTKFNPDKVSATAKKLKTFNSVRSVLDEELMQLIDDEEKQPSEEFIRFVFSRINSKGRFTAKVKEELGPIIKTSLEKIINDKAQASVDEIQNQLNKKREEARLKTEDNNNGIVTTQEEKDAYNIIRAVTSEIVSPSRIEMRDAKSYCAILFDNNNRRPICRLHFNDPSKKSLTLFDGGSEENIKIKDLNEIFSFKKRILDTVKKYL